MRSLRAALALGRGFVVITHARVFLNLRVEQRLGVVDLRALADGVFDGFGLRRRLLLLRGFRDPLRELLLRHEPRAPANLARVFVVHLLEGVEFLVSAREEAVDLLVRVRRVGVSVVEALREELGQELFALLGGGGVVEEPSLDHFRVDALLGLRGGVNLLLNRVCRNHRDDAHLLALTDAVRAVLCLSVHLRVPVDFEKDDGVSRLQVQTHPAGARREHKDEIFRVLGVKVGQKRPAVFRFGGAVEAEVLVASPLHVVLEDVHAANHLAEEEHAVTGRFELREHPIKELKLSARADNLVRRWGAVVHLVHEKQVRMIAHFAQLHRGILKPARFSQAILEADTRGFEHLAVVMLLPRRELALDHHLNLVRKLLFNLGFAAAQKEGAKNLVQTVNDEQLFLVAHQGRIGVSVSRRSCGKGLVEPLRKSARAGEDVGKEKVQQRPQLFEVVLDRRSRQQESVAALVVVLQDFRQFALVVLQAVSLVDDDVAPRNLVQEALVTDDEVVVGDDDVERAVGHALVAQVLALVGLTLVNNHIHAIIEPDGKLALPVGQHRLWRDDEVRPFIAFLLVQVSHERDGLNRLAEAHLIGQNAVEVVVVERHHPLQTGNLVRAKLPAFAARTDEHLRLRLNHLVFGVHKLLVALLPRKQVLVALLILLHLCRARVLAAIGRLLILNLRAERFEQLVCLFKQLVEAVVLGLLDELVVALLIILLESLQAHAFLARHRRLFLVVKVDDAVVSLATLTERRGPLLAHDRAVVHDALQERVSRPDDAYLRLVFALALCEELLLRAPLNRLLLAL
mmetsp:Transcript_10985/g.36071  ORF Transcript_10985/g.36071 Transcript_10985/m.36071 type:complete len:799 (-) Transcript_10985:551-2947(-)